MSDWIVACPACGTQFRVTQAHLAPANGLVRCGACLMVFRAEAERVFAAEEVGAPSAAAADAVDGLGAGATAALPLEFEAGTGATIPETVHRQQAKRHRPVLGGAAPDITGPVREAVTAAMASTVTDASAVGVPPRLDEITLPAEAERVEAALEAQRLAFERRRRAGPWALLSLLALIVLGAQLVWLRFDELALAPETHGLVASACEWLGCALPVRRDASAIRSQRLMVRSHPERDDGLRVDAVIVNRAPWPQAFPEIELRFSAIDGELLAARRFEPAEYLAGELAGRREMPVAAPVQISLDLIDPGPRAVNYEMRLH